MYLYLEVCCTFTDIAWTRRPFFPNKHVSITLPKHDMSVNVSHKQQRKVCNIRIQKHALKGHNNFMLDNIFI